MGILSNFVEAVNNPPAPVKSVTEEENTNIATEDLTAAISVPTQDGEGGQPKPAFPIPVQVKETENGNEFRIILNNFSNPKSQIALQQLLASASESDTIIMDVSNVAGFLYSTLSIASMMKACKANVITIFSVVDSLEALIIWLAGKEKTIAATPFLSLEGIKYGNSGSVIDQVTDSENTLKMQAELLAEIVEAGVLTQEEAAGFEKHETVLIKFGDELKERLLPIIQKSATPKTDTETNPPASEE